MMKFISKYLIYCFLYLLIVTIFSWTYFSIISNINYIVSHKLQISIIKGIYVTYLGGELIVFILMIFVYLVKNILYLYNWGLATILWIYIAIIFILVLAFLELRTLSKYDTILEWIRVIHVNGWGEIATIIVGIIIYYREVRPLFVKYI